MELTLGNEGAIGKAVILYEGAGECLLSWNSSTANLDGFPIVRGY
jgi:hypothetical protein